ncbi:hypothetical protein ACQR1W_28305 [Bradyrhizobium sp. HKCCYLS1011]|uniref:hypothetical protein n=1 Tax=Bradyrhizobium sp. HKCCYLS1011 TaxID=3420733 RepID=UPI003EC0EC94
MTFQSQPLRSQALRLFIERGDLVVDPVSLVLPRVRFTDFVERLLDGQFGCLSHVDLSRWSRPRSIVRRICVLVCGLSLIQIKASWMLDETAGKAIDRDQDKQRRRRSGYLASARADLPPRTMARSSKIEDGFRLGMRA